MFLNKNLWLRLLLFSRGRSSRENIVVWSWSWSCVTVAFIHITGCQWVSLNHSWGGREIIHRAQWAAAKFTCVLFDYFHADVCSVQVCGLSCERTCCQIQWPDWSDCLLGSKKSSWVWKCCEFVQWNYTVVVKDYIARPFEKAFRYMIYQFTHGGRWYYRQRTLHAHMKVKVLLTHKRLFPIVVPRLAQTKQHVRTNRRIVVEDDDLGLVCSLSFLQSVSWPCTPLYSRVSWRSVVRMLVLFKHVTDPELNFGLNWATQQECDCKHKLQEMNK